MQCCARGVVKVPRALPAFAICAQNERPVVFSLLGPTVALSPASSQNCRSAWALADQTAMASIS